MRRIKIACGVAAGLAGLMGATHAPAQQGQTTINIYPPAGSPPPIVNVFPPGTPVPGAAPAAPAPQADAVAPGAADAGGASQPGAAPAAAEASGLSATAAIPGPAMQGSTQVRAEITSLKRVTGSLMLNVRMSNIGDTDANSVAVHTALTNAYILDPSSNRKAEPLKDSNFQALASDMSQTGIPVGESRDLFVQFPEAPPGVNSVTVYLGGFPPIMNVPIS